MVGLKVSIINVYTVYNMQMLIQKFNLAYSALQYLHVTIKLTSILIIHVAKTKD